MCKSNKRAGRSVVGNQASRANLPLREWKREDWEAEALSLGIEAVRGAGFIARANLANLQAAVRLAWDSRDVRVPTDAERKAAKAAAKAQADREAAAKAQADSEAIRAARRAIALVWDGFCQPSQAEPAIQAGKVAGLTDRAIQAQEAALRAADCELGKEPGWPAREAADRAIVAARKAAQAKRHPVGNGGAFGGMSFGSPTTKGKKPRKVRGKKYGTGPGKLPVRPKKGKGGEVVEIASAADKKADKKARKADKDKKAKKAKKAA